jgi:DNA (cytosine-5)-methyltransferase 1
MGLPDTFRIPVSDTRAYKQFGNCVAVPVIREAALLMSQFIKDDNEQLSFTNLAVAA